jgi:IS30 family transposase
VDRASRFTILLHLPGRHTAEAVRDALIAAMSCLPPQLRRSLTWDQGKEMAPRPGGHRRAGHAGVLLRPGQPWQRGSNENTNGLLRQYFPKGSDLRAHSPGDLAAVAAELNARPRKTPGWDAPAALLGL